MVWENAGSSLFDLGDGVLNLEFRTKMNTLGSEVVEGMNTAYEKAEKESRGLIIGNQGANFSAGANLGMVFMFAIEQAGLLSALKRENEDYMLFVETDIDCQDDSSLWYDYSSESFALYQGHGPTSVRYGLNVNELRTLILNHVGARNPRGIGRKEFIKNLAGNYLIVNNETGEISGTAPTTVGYLGDIRVNEIPEIMYVRGMTNVN